MKPVKPAKDKWKACKKKLEEIRQPNKDWGETKKNEIHKQGVDNGAQVNSLQ